MTIHSNDNLVTTSDPTVSDASTNHKNKATPILPPQGMSRAKDILLYLPFSRTTLHEWSRDGRFPAGIKLSPNMVVWRNNEVLEWLSNYPNNTSTPSEASGGSDNE